MKARDLMSYPVISVRPHLPVHDAAARLVTNGFTAAPVVTAEGAVLGMVTEGDLMRSEIRPSEDPADSGVALPVSEVMPVGLIAVHPDDNVADVAALLLDFGVRAVPVIDEGNHLVGIITRRDILRGTPSDTSRGADSAAR